MFLGSYYHQYEPDSCVQRRRWTRTAMGSTTTDRDADETLSVVSFLFIIFYSANVLAQGNHIIEQQRDKMPQW